MANETDQKVVRLYVSGIRPAQIARETDLKLYRVYQVLHAQRVPLLPQGHQSEYANIKPEGLPVLLRLYSERQLAHNLGVSKTVVHNWHKQIKKTR